ncbi:ribosome biogenesis GTPase YlqF [Pullulanibacillus sp. KACC 23026]|uniref:ribosome biogenesis GTPase YlqF n=1 Tax=Pullulanibacillus sp. KACC 23026 TaxID=3028315 RepID=UPI0023B18D79|nr:ribosome biogenesis GTPase YlqF [Pullulanibacillus sp. KACC 23026]WEG14995.1 ribosome biogenesis GTPase YlqF [Pullulanibacillus sp. KACC 23026]
MAKAKRQMIEKMKLIDVVIELLDARAPMASRNPMIDEIVGNKPRVLILNKSDMADPEQTRAWQKALSGENQRVLAVNSQDGDGTSLIPKAVRELTEEKRQRAEAKGMNPRADRALILGIPNVGKSTLINRLANKRIAKIGDRPGITKQQQWIKVGKTMELLDTPGILWPKFEDETVGLKLAATGAIKDEIIDLTEVAGFIVRVLSERYPDLLMDRYKLEAPLDDDLWNLLEGIGRSRGMVRSGGHIDMDRTSEMIVREFRSLKIGHVTLETPE